MSERSDEIEKALRPEPDLDWQRAVADPAQPLVAHLIELRQRLIWSLVILGVGMAACYPWSGDFLDWLARGAAGGVYFTAPTEAFMMRMKAAALLGAAATLPLLLHQVWLFVARALSPELRRALVRLLPLSYILFVLGASLAIFVVVPAAMKFLLSYGSADIQPLLTLAAYLQFVGSLALAFGLAFQLPIVLWGLNKAGLVSRQALARRRRYGYVAIFAAAAFMTPGPDIFSQLALAVPAVILFEVTLWTLS